MASNTKTELTEQIIVIPIKDIVIDRQWNGRSGDYKADSGDEEQHTFIDLVRAIQVNGQDTPVTLRQYNNKLYLTAGFRRCDAILHIAQVTGEKNPTVKAIIKNLDETQARALNIRENTGREDLKPPDLAWALWDLALLYKKNGKKVVSVDISGEIGKSQPYVSRLLKIMEFVKPSITKAWRESNIAYSVDELYKIATIPKTEQDAAWNALISGKEEGSNDKGPNSWVKTARNKASSIAELLGKLERQKLIDTSGLDFQTHIELLVKIKGNCNARQKASISSAAQKAYDKALETEEEIDEED
jgi:ParB/RepB/Spo0J family partition protein